MAESVGIAGLPDVCASQIAIQTTYAVKVTACYLKSTYMYQPPIFLPVYPSFGFLITTDIFGCFQMAIEQAKKFAVHGRRRRVTAEDIDSAFTLDGYPVFFAIV